MRSLEWALILYDWCPYKKKLGSRHPQWEGCVMTEKMASINKGEKLSEEINVADTLTSNFQPLELWENEFLLFKPPKSMVLCYGSPRKLL